MNPLLEPWWTCIAGARRYMTGERRSIQSQHDVAAKCAACPNLRLFKEDELHGLCGRLVRWFLPSHAPLTGWCGEPSVRTDTTCGCLVLAEPGRGRQEHVAITLHGQSFGVAAAGKTTIAAEHCPSGRWFPEPTASRKESST